jgi:uncharacterized protein
MTLAISAALGYGCQPRGAVENAVVDRAAVASFAEESTGAAVVREISAELDSDRDGFPDVVEIVDEVDRRNFRRWMTLIAESLFYGEHARWGESNRDCAGLARYAIVEALKEHNREWRSKNNYLPEMAIPDVRKYRYPDVPLLGKNIFRTRAGYFRKGDELSQTFSNFADAENLLLYNVKKLDDTTKAQPGDLLFYRNENNSHYPYHVMIFIGEGSVYTGHKDYVVYHTGPDGDDPGEVRKARLALLKNHPNPKWRPLPENESFLGTFRLKLVD